MLVSKTSQTIEHLDGLKYEQFHVSGKHGSTTGHIIWYDQNLSHLNLVISKASEALNPETALNHTGAGGTLEQLIASQKDLRFIINGTFNHYRKHFYKWDHNNFNIGDPVGYVKIRNLIYEDIALNTLNGFLFLEGKSHWKIVGDKPTHSKYILGSRPVLIQDSKAIDISLSEFLNIEQHKITPPSYLIHGPEAHARTAVGNKDDSLGFIVIEGDGANEQKGVTLHELQEFGMTAGFETLLNLDGGGSSRFWLKTEDNLTIQSSVPEEDKERILGHTLMLFSSKL